MFSCRIPLQRDNQDETRISARLSLYIPYYQWLGIQSGIVGFMEPACTLDSVEGSEPAVNLQEYDD